MPWKETCKMEQREQFIREAVKERIPFRHLCAQYGISHKTGYKWLQRFYESGWSGFKEESRRPGHSPKRLSEETVCDLIRLKGDHLSWGAKKILVIYSKRHPYNAPSLSSVNRIFKRAGLVKTRKKRYPKTGARMISNVEVAAPNDLWTMDFKGWWKTSENTRFEPLTLRDDFSRYILLAEAMAENTESVKRALIKAFKQYGMPKVIQSDNGAPFAARSNIMGLSQLSAWLISLGIHIHLSRPGKPQDNGGHERMHRDLKNEVQVRFRGDHKLYQAELDIWRDEFNTLRPHEALNMKTPSDLYVNSKRKYFDTETEIDYPNDFRIRKVNNTGCIKLFNEQYFITSALRGYQLGLKTVDEEKLDVYFSDYILGTINIDTMSFATV
ncbi:MAG: DDE-type integrase/transposase/recombinase [Candidatus Marinimicrobia bacterium]|nr:DDE-type integrase/transposase/recombinase [Candidatus Neomarinimicrobiota bacterium]